MTLEVDNITTFDEAADKLAVVMVCSETVYAAMWLEMTHGFGTSTPSMFVFRDSASRLHVDL